MRSLLCPVAEIAIALLFLAHAFWQLFKPLYPVYPNDITSTIGSTIYTPASSIVENFWDGDDKAVPWPEGVYMIKEKASGKAITLVNGSPCLRSTEEEHNEYNYWLCVKTNGYFGFFNPKTGKYIGHDGQSNIQASADSFLDWEYFTPRQHPNGGYQLLSPFWHHTLMELAVADNGKTLIRREHGTTLWEFVKVPKH
jgi:hypothetical protein